MIETEQKTVVIVTALGLETAAVLRHLSNISEESLQGTVCHRGTFEDWDVVVVEAGAGNIGAALLAARLIGHYQPEIALFVGIGGGVKDVKLGDVVAATKVYGYESGRDTATGFKPRPDLQHSAHTLESHCRAMRQRKGWLKRLNPALKHKTPKLEVGPIAAGEKVVASTRAPTAVFLKQEYSDALAVEMEGKGFLEAAHISSTTATVIRGISDLLSKKSAADKTGSQPRAADAASAVAFELLSKLASTPAAGPPRTKPQPKKPVPQPMRTKKKKAAKPPAKARPEPQPPAKAHLEIAPTLNEGSFFTRGEVLARVGVPNVDQVLFSFATLPDAFVRIIPTTGLPEPIPFAQLMDAASDAPLLKHRQYGGFIYLNRHGALIYDPAGPHRGGPAPLSWATQLFPNGELWLMSTTAIVRERGSRPEWVPIPLIPALLAEQMFYDKTHAAVSLAVSRLGLKFPCDVELGILRTAGAYLGIRDDAIRGPIQAPNVIYRHTLKVGHRPAVDEALLGFFARLHDVTGYARPNGLFHFPPDPPRP